MRDESSVKLRGVGGAKVATDKTKRGLSQETTREITTVHQISPTKQLTTKRHNQGNSLTAKDQVGLNREQTFSRKSGSHRHCGIICDKKERL